jgi:phage-related protein
MAIPGVTFDTKHSYKDYGLILSSKTIGQPDVKTETVDVPGMDGVLDLTESLGSVRYKNRKVEMKFSYPYTKISSWNDTTDRFANYLHGNYINRVIFDDDKGWSYAGRCTITEMTASKGIGTLKVQCDAQPYKTDTVVDAQGRWLWDPFSFVDGVIYPGTITVSGTKTVNLPNGGGKPVTPTFICSAAMTLTLNGTSYTLEAGTTKNYDIQLNTGDNSAIFKGTGTVQIIYQKISL